MKIELITIQWSYNLAYCSIFHLYELVSKEKVSPKFSQKPGSDIQQSYSLYCWNSCQDKRMNSFLIFFFTKIDMITTFTNIRSVVAVMYTWFVINQVTCKRKNKSYHLQHLL